MYGYGTLKCNIINENSTGICVKGKKVSVNIQDNMHIAFNRGVGIKVMMEAIARIKNNQI